MNSHRQIINMIFRLSHTLCALFYVGFISAQFSVIGPIDPPSIPLDECKHRMIQSYDKDVYNSFARYGKTQQNMYYYIYVATNFPYNTTILYYPASEVANIYGHHLQQMDTLSFNVYFKILQEGCKHNEPLCIKNFAQLYGMIYQDTLTALDYYRQYLQMEVPREKHQRSVEIFLEYLIDPVLSNRGRIVQPINKFTPETLDDWRYRIFWAGDISAYHQLITRARQSSNVFDFYECLYYSLVMAGKYAYEPAKADLREILSTMITDATPKDALAYRLLDFLL